MTTVAPHKYAQIVKDDLARIIANESADFIMNRCHLEPGIFARIVGPVPFAIPEKYHNILKSILIATCVQTVCKKATYSVSMHEKHHMLKRALMYAGNVRESAGR